MVICFININYTIRYFSFFPFVSLTFHCRSTSDNTKRLHSIAILLASHIGLVIVSFCSIVMLPFVRYCIFNGIYSENLSTSIPCIKCRVMYNNWIHAEPRLEYARTPIFSGILIKPNFSLRLNKSKRICCTTI